MGSAFFALASPDDDPPGRAHQSRAFRMRLRQVDVDGLSQNQEEEGPYARRYRQGDPTRSCRLVAHRRAKSNEIPAVCELAARLDVAGRVITVDAMHAQQKTARYLLGCRADYVITAIKENQPTILDDLQAIDFGDAPAHETIDKGHIERRRCAAIAIARAASATCPKPTGTTPHAPRRRSTPSCNRPTHDPQPCNNAPTRGAIGQACHDTTKTVLRQPG